HTLTHAHASVYHQSVAILWFVDWRSDCGLSRCVTRYLSAMAIADLMVLVTDVLLNRLNRLYFPSSFLLYTPVCSLGLVLIMASLNASVWFTVAFTFDRCVAVSCQRLRARYCTERTANTVLLILSLLGIAEAIPWYFMFQPLLVINGLPMYCIERPTLSTSPTWAALRRFDRLANPLIPIVAILLLNGLTVRKMVSSNRTRRRLRGASAEYRDPEIESRRRSIALLFAITGSFVLLWSNSVVYFLGWSLQNYSYLAGGRESPRYIAQQTGFMLVLLICCTNTFIYAVTQTRFRQEIKKGVEALLALTPLHTFSGSVAPVRLCVGVRASPAPNVCVFLHPCVH
uniref:G-protein coupled receptors family 1 profile domain-containing protein n=1 Tax=Callorhinchus milii TaxID=7868 RepID=A0A4W3HC91_CALMI